MGDVFKARVPLLSETKTQALELVVSLGIQAKNLLKTCYKLFYISLDLNGSSDCLVPTIRINCKGVINVPGIKKKEVHSGH